MIKYVSFFIFSTVLFINTNAFSMDKDDSLITPENRSILSAWVNKDMEDPAEESKIPEEEIDNKKKPQSRVLIKTPDTTPKDPNEEKALLEASLGKEYTPDPMLDNEVPLLTKPQFAALIFFKFFIQTPIEIIDNSVKTAPILIKSTVSFSIDSANNIWNFIEFICFLYDPDSVLDELYSVEKGI